MHPLHSDLIDLAHRFGSDEEFVRAGGGNISAKHDGVMYIKPSGVAMADLNDEDLVPLDVAILLAALHCDAPVDGDPVRVAAQAAQIGDAGGRRPSVEILFHALIEDPLVLHLHPLAANAVTCNEDGPSLTADLLGDQAIWVDYLDPGVPLARGIEAARAQFTERTGSPAPAITLLGNHGIIVSGGTAAEVAERTTWLTDAIQAAIGTTPASPARELDITALAEFFRRATGKSAVAHASDGVAHAASGLGAGPVSRGPLIPDQIVYAGSFPVILDLTDDAAAVGAQVAAFAAAHGRAPITAVIPEQGVIAVGDSQRGASTALGTYLDALRVARDADRIGRVRVMSDTERDFIENWEAESYRKSVAAKD